METAMLILSPESSVGRRKPDGSRPSTHGHSRGNAGRAEEKRVSFSQSSPRAGFRQSPVLVMRGKILNFEFAIRNSSRWLQVAG
jgi:hypothetical protein